MKHTGGLAYLMCLHLFNYAILTEQANALYCGATDNCLQAAS